MPLLRTGIVSAAAGTLVGPTAAILYESGGLHVFRAMPLLNIWVVVAFGGFGLWAGVRAFRDGIVVVGVVCLVANAAVLGFYGFLASLFVFGGR